MKEASGELNMTVVTIVAVAAVGALFYVFIWPVIQRSIVTQTCRTYGTNWSAVETTDASGDSEIDTGSNATVRVWMCCPDGDASSNRCVRAEQ
ncbi:MAG: hypothetical protein IJK67_02475 [Bacilli bacterium]|nr:hypothetical protein [Bacilli bacterium]